MFKTPLIWLVNWFLVELNGSGKISIGSSGDLHLDLVDISPDLKKWGQTLHAVILVRGGGGKRVKSVQVSQVSASKIYHSTHHPLVLKMTTRRQPPACSDWVGFGSGGFRLNWFVRCQVRLDSPIYSPNLSSYTIYSAFSISFFLYFNKSFWQKIVIFSVLVFFLNKIKNNKSGGLF